MSPMRMLARATSQRRPRTQSSPPTDPVGRTPQPTSATTASLHATIVDRDHSDMVLSGRGKLIGVGLCDRRESGLRVDRRPLAV